MILKNTRLVITIFIIFLSLPLTPSFAINDPNNEPAPDSTIPGPHPVTTSEYRLPAAVDKEVLADRMTEIWAQMYYPKDFASITGKIPLIVMLHGNHATCGRGSNPRRDDSCIYTETGQCPSGYVVVPNHEGYAYLAHNLASWGYWVVSINANRGINCGGGIEGDAGLNLTRGKLVLKHLSLLYKWNSQGGAPDSLGLGNTLNDKIDFGNVGYFGHSRGGEGMRAAYNLYLDPGSPWPEKIPGLKVKAIYEIGAVDGQTSRVLDAIGTVWNQLLPMCDGDVSDLQGRYPFERMLLHDFEHAAAQKSLYEVWGANHNYFNTEWQESDAGSCFAGKPIFDPNKPGSEFQQKVALASLPAFFRSRLGVNPAPSFNQNFNPMHILPDVVTRITQIDRDFTASPGATEMSVLEDFDKETGINSSGNMNEMQQIRMTHKLLITSPRRQHPQRVADLSWLTSGERTFFKAILTKKGEGKNLLNYATLDIRLSRQVDGLNTDPFTDFSIQLEDATGQLSTAVLLSNYTHLNGPGSRNPVLKTVRIPLRAFSRVNFSKIHGVKFTFNKTKTGAIYLANIRTNRQRGVGKENQTVESVYMTNLIPQLMDASVSPTIVPVSVNTIKIIRRVKSSYLSGKTAIEIVLASQVPFPAMNSLPILNIDNKEFKLSRYSDFKELKEIIFTIPEDEYKNLTKSAEMTVTDGKIWQFDSLDHFDSKMMDEVINN